LNTASPKRRKERIDRGIKIRSDGLYALMSWREMAYLIIPRTVLIGGLLLLPLVLPGMYWPRVITITCIYALLALGFDFLAHYVGLVCLGGAFFVGVGGYLAAILNTSFGLPPLLTVPLATVLGAGICTLLLFPCLPLRGVYFAIVSLMYPLFAARVIEAFDIFGGTDGILGIEGFSNRWVEQYFVIGIMLVFLFALRRLVNTDLGLVLRGVKDNDQAIRASGMNITRFKTIAVFIAAALGCLGGACLVHIYMWSGISQFALDFSILPIAATVIGGSATLVGPVLGCLILLAFVVFRSEGLMVYGQRKYHQFERWTNI